MSTSTSRFSSVGLRWKTQINEDAQKLCHANVFTELNHNEIEIYHSNDGFFPIIIRENGEQGRVKKQIEAAKEIIKDYEEVWVNGESHLTKLFYAIHLGDWVSYYLATSLGIEPEPTENINSLKERIK